jgi:hypothetical protein
VCPNSCETIGLQLQPHRRGAGAVHASLLRPALDA